MKIYSFLLLLISLHFVCSSQASSVLDNTAHLVAQQAELKDREFVFNLAASPPSAQGLGGDQFSFNRKKSRALRLSNGRNGGGGEQVLFEFAPCGFRTPHHHPRGTENFFIVKGKVAANFIRADGRPVTNIVGAGNVGFFPKASVHFLQNVGCENATTLSVFGTSDPGVVEFTENLRFPFDIIQLVLGNRKLNAKEKVLENIIQRSQACLKRCGLMYD